MAPQRKITKKYRDELFVEVKNGEGLERYVETIFPVNEKKIGECRFSAPQGLLEKMNPTDDFESAVALFEAYKDISPLEAGDSVFWESLAHIDLFPYVQKRWTPDSKDLKNYVLNHWFVTRGMIRHSLVGLWWAVKCSYDEEGYNPYELTEILFKNYSFRTTFYGASTLIRSKEATIGILSFLKDNADLQGNMEIIGRFITNYFNKLGATKQLAYLGRGYFYNELTRIKPEIVKLKNRGDIANSVNSMIE